MSRAHALALSLVNWKGVFFERYLLDRHVTALEGANGAGKTTVMIAAYVVLLPDLQRLKFTNLGETGATGGDRGIWGRLGEAGPSYSALEIELGAGERVLCGVHLERKAAPSLSLTPFLISGLGALTSERFLLRQSDAHEEVCPLPELEQRAAEQGCTLEVFGSGKDYFARLFELGITALRLSTDEERNKLNDMLRTSMTGGISRTLTSDLRSFLFKRESGLFDTLSRMRQNLEACRRTRLEVSEARILEREISGIHGAGHAMVGAALGASRALRAERQRGLGLAEQALARASQLVLELETALEEVLLRTASLSPRLGRAQAAEQSAREQWTRLERAAAAAERLRAAQAGLSHTEAPLAEALERKARATALRESTKAQRNEAQATLVRAAAGLASLQAGLEELHRQSHAYGRVREQLAVAKRLLAEGAGASEAEEGELRRALAALEGMGDIGGAAADAGSVATEAVVQLGEQLTPVSELGAAATPAARGVGPTDSVPAPLVVGEVAGWVGRIRRGVERERAELHRLVSTAESRKREYGAARAALASLTGIVGDADLGLIARRELGRLNELELLATRVPELEREAQRLRALAQRQQALGAELRALGFEPLPGASEFVARLSELELRLRDAEQSQRQHESNGERELERAAALEAQLPALAARSERYQRLAQVAQRRAARGARAPSTRAELGEQMRAVEAARRAAHDRARLAEERRERALALALEQEPSGEGPQKGLLRLAEKLDGQLLVQRYEELPIAEARRTQAELGPLNDAIVVEDPERALPALCAEEHAPESVWLVRAGGWPAHGNAPASEAPGHVVVDLGYGLRVTRLPETVQLGRAARERRARELRAEAQGLEQERELALAELRELDADRAELEQLWEQWEAWASGDPAQELAQLGSALSSARERIAEQQRLAREHRLEAARLKGQYDAARPLLGEHQLLDPPDQVAAAEAARRELSLARGASAELARVQAARATLVAQLHILDSPAPEGAEPQNHQRRAERLDAQSDRLFAVAEALGALEREHAAWAWVDAPRALAERTRLVPELEAQHERAQQELSRAQVLFESAEADWEAATAAAQGASASRAAAEAHVARAQAELTAEGGDPAGAGLAEQRAELERLAEAVARLRAEERGIAAEVALCRERLKEAQQARQRAEQELVRERGLSEPVARASEELLAAARAAGMAEAHDDAGRSSAQLWLEAESKRALLADRLQAARGGAELAQSVNGARAGGNNLELEFGRQVIARWVEVRDWLAKRLPAQLAELSPQQGMQRLEADLEQLERRLERQEGDLRGTSGDVARSIEVQVRRAVAQVRRLNASLEGVSFGSIHGIRVQIERVSKMEQVLRALRDGETQELLFQSNLPIEAALDEIFKRHSGARNGGERLIDYREYLELWVCIQRRPDAEWERVNPSQVSTGEAIGVGAALMMVILAEWEREDQLLRRQKALGSLRFLFLDEANRLSQDNLGVLFDLCKTLDLQLLIAAPEVARAEGNTTYRLVRRVKEDGREEVLVTGRRATLPSPPTVSEVVPPPEPVQAALFAS